MKNYNYLQYLLKKLDNQSYKAYKDIKGKYQFPNFTLIIDHVQGDPFASPSKIRVQISQSVAKFPNELYKNYSREVALRDYLTRQFSKIIEEKSAFRGSGKSGLITIVETRQEILDRSSAFIDKIRVEIRFCIGLPARGRRILGFQAIEMLCEDIPEIVDKSLKYELLNQTEIKTHIETVEDADFIRQELDQKGLVAFVANNSILPRLSGVDPRPLDKEALPFLSPSSLEVEFNCPNQGLIKGMGIPKGITLIVGGGYHGKSTLLKGIELGVYNHIPQDGREFVISNSASVKIRAEDGRSIVGVNISPFIKQLPQGKSTEKFSSTNASGSTSQAANIIEALEAGAKVLLLDEDTTATNFMIRDHRMQKLIAKDKEPITPYLDKVRQLYNDYGVSTILVMGGSGDYFDVADTVIALDNFKPENVTQKAKEIAKNYDNKRNLEGGDNFGKLTFRIPNKASIDPSRGKKAVKIQVRDINTIDFGEERIDLTGIEQIVEKGQLRAIAFALIYAKEKYMNNQQNIPEILDGIMDDISKEGLDVLSYFPEGDFTLFRPFELAATINRLRSLKVENKF
jgi:predicted ABC-class ATPase